MKIVKKDQGLLNAERRLKERKIAEEKKRTQFLANLSANNNFRKYVIDGIIKKHIDSLNNLRNISVDLKDPSEAGNLLFQSKAAVKILENILAELL